MPGHSPTPSTDPNIALASYEAAVAGLRASLVDVDSSPSYLMLTSGSLEGETDRRFRAAAAGSADLWPILAAIDSALVEAREVAEATGRFGGDAPLRARVFERWITIPGSSLPGDRQFTAAEAIELFRQRFDAIRAGVAEVDQVWLELLPRLDAARETLARLAGEADQLAVLEPLVGRARALAEDLESRLLSDPIGIADGDPANLDRLVNDAANQMARLRSGHDALSSDLASTEVVLAELRALRAASAASRVSSLEKVKDPVGLIHTPGPSIIDGPNGLAEQLDGLFDDTTAWTQRRTLLDGWLRSADRLRTQLERAEQANRAPLRERDELRGRLTAYRAKMASIGRGEDLALAEMADEARTELYTAPVDLERADRLIDRLAEALRS